MQSLYGRLLNSNYIYLFCGIQMRHSDILLSRSTRLNIKADLHFQEPLSPGSYLAYKRPSARAAGKWTVCWINPVTRQQLEKNIGSADDLQDANGKTIFTYAQAKAMATGWLEQKARLLTNEGSDTDRLSHSFTISDALRAYFKDGERRAMKGVDRDRMSAEAWIVPRLGSLEVSKLTRNQLEGWLDDIAEAPRRIRTKTGHRSAFAAPPATEDEKRARKDSANRVFSILKAALNHAVNRSLIDIKDPTWQKIKPFKGTSKARVRFLGITEQVKLINACQPDFCDLVKGALLTGCRYSELARLQCKDYISDTEIPTIFVAQSKSGKPRHIVLTTEGVALFDELKARARSPNELIFTNNIRRKKRTDPNSQGWLESDQKRYMKKAWKAAGLDPITFHELRHTYASMLVNNKCPLPVVAQQLGHSDSRMVEKHYGHMMPSYVAEMVRAALPVLGVVESANVTSGQNCDKPQSSWQPICNNSR